MDIDGAVGIVTGGASGLGLATTEALLAAGARVVMLDLPGSPGEKEAERLGERARFVAADVRSEDDVAAALDVADSLGALRVAVNCAGTGNAIRILGKKGVFPLDDFKRIVDINLIGTFNVIRLAAERMVRHEPVGEERGVIVNTASVAAFDGQVGQTAYSASKAGVAGMTLPIARDLAQHRIRVVTVAPGLVRHPADAGRLPGAARLPRHAGAAPGPARQSPRVRCAGGAHRRQSDAQRRGHPPRRGDPYGAPLSRARQPKESTCVMQ